MILRKNSKRFHFCSRYRPEKRIFLNKNNLKKFKQQKWYNSNCEQM